MTSETKPTVWITRTAPAAFKSAAVWAEAGYAAAIYLWQCGQSFR